MDTLLTHQKQSDKSILICDPDYISATLVSSLIKNRIGCNCTVVTDGRSGLELLEENHVDLIITEIYLPYISGMAMVERIRKMLSSTIPILILSTDKRHGAGGSLDLTHVDDFADKPIQFQALEKKISSLLVKNTCHV